MNSKFSLSEKQLAWLKKMLPKTKTAVDLPNLVSELERIGSRYRIALGSLGCQPSRETWDRRTASRPYEAELAREHSWLTPRKGNAMSKRVIEADRQLILLGTDLAKVWKQATGRSISGWRVSESEETRAHRAAVAAKHPLGLLLDALGVYVAGASVDELARLGKRRAAVDRGVA